MFASLRHKPFRLFTSGIFMAQMGYEMQNVALSWYMYKLTGSALSLGLMGLARIIPVFLFALIAGHISDTRPRRKVLMTAQSILLINATILATIIATGHASAWVIYGAIVANSIALTFSSPAGQAFLPALIPQADFMNAISINSISYRAALVIGPSIAGFILAKYSVLAPIAVNIICLIYFLTAIILIGKRPQILAERTEGRMRSIMKGIHFVRSSRLLWSTMLLDFFATFFGSGMTLMPVFAQDILRVGPAGLGLLYAAPSIGGLLGGFLFSAVQKVKRQGYVLIIAVIVYGIATVLFGLSTSFLLSLFLMGVVGAADMVSSVIRSTLRQVVTPDNLRGRMVSINMMFYLGGPQLGEVESGLFASLIGTPATVVVGGIATVFATVFFAARIPELMGYKHK
jgi:MFS family permease